MDGPIPTAERDRTVHNMVRPSNDRPEVEPAHYREELVTAHAGAFHSQGL